MAGFTFDKEVAMSADKGGHINAGGVYVGFITKMISFKTDGGAGGVELSLESLNGEKCDYVKIYTKNKDGSENFAKAKITALLGLLGINNLPAVKTDDPNIFEFPLIYKRKIAFALKREEYLKSDDVTIGWKMELLHFFDGDTLQTYKEKVEGSTPKTSQREIKDIIIGPPDNGNDISKTGGFNTYPDTSDDDLPF